MYTSFFNCHNCNCHNRPVYCLPFFYKARENPQQFVAHADGILLYADVPAHIHGLEVRVSRQENEGFCLAKCKFSWKGKDICRKMITFATADDHRMQQMKINGQNIFLRAIRNEHVPSEDDSYPFNLPIVRNLRTLEFPKSVTYIVGENGSGKSTLLEAIANLLGLNVEGGTKNFNFRTQETHSSLYEELRAVRADLKYGNAFFFRAESFYNFASEVDRIAREDRSMLCSYGGISLHEQSHGESFMSLIANRLQRKGLYIFDEPEAALSYMNQLRFLVWMKDAVAAGSQIIISTHSPVILAYPGAAIYVAEGGQLTLSSYDDCYIYRDMRAFITNKDLVIKELLGE